VTRVVSEPVFREALQAVLLVVDRSAFDMVTGPGRSGAVAAVYASHRLGLPFLPFGAVPPPSTRVLVVDTVAASGRTIRKAVSKYQRMPGVTATSVVVFDHPPGRLHFWYERNANHDQ